MIGYYLQAGALAWMPLLAVLPLCCFQFAMLLAVEFPDAAGDRQAGKRNLVVRWGGRGAARLYAALLVAAYTLLPLLVWAGLPEINALLFALLSPLALWLIWRISRGDWQNPRRWNGLAFFSIVLLMGSATLQLAAFLLLLA